MTKIVLDVKQQGDKHRAIASVFTEQGTTVYGKFSFNGGFLNLAGATAGGQGLAKLSSDQIQSTEADDEFGIVITGPASGVLMCSVTVGDGTETCQ